MKNIMVPNDVDVTIQGKSLKLPFKQFVIDALESYQLNGKSVKQLRQLNKIIDAIEKSVSTISLEDVDYEVVKASMHYDEGGDWLPGVGRKLLSYFDAIENPVNS